jgi:hypothetical protein
MRAKVATPTEERPTWAGSRAVKSRREGLTDAQLSVLVTLGTFLILAPGLFWGVPGGKAIVGGLRILEGDIPYRDFWTMYAPGQFYLTAVLFRAFGTHVWVQGVAVLVLVAVAAGVLFQILRNRLAAPLEIALLITAVLVGMEWRLSPEMSSYEPILVCALLACNFLLQYFAGGGATRLVCAGVCFGIGAWFKHDVALYWTAGSAAALILSWIATDPIRPSTWLRPFRAVGLLTLTAGLVVLPVVVWIGWKAGADAWQDLVRFPSTDFPIVRGEPYPSLLPPWRAWLAWLAAIGNVGKAVPAINQSVVWIQANAPQLIFLVGVAWILAQRRKVDPARIAAGLLFLSCMPFFWAAAHVQQNTHLGTMAILSFLLGAVALNSISRNQYGVKARRLLILAFSMYAVGLLLRPALNASQVLYFWPGTRMTSIPVARGILLPRTQLEVYEPIVSFVQNHVAPTEPIYVGVARHDAIVISNQAFYYLAQRRSVSRFNELHPAVADHPEYQQEIIDAIERQHVRCVILWRFGWPTQELDEIRDRRRARLPQLGARVLDEFFRNEFDVLARYGEYDLMWRRGIPRPAGW